uniref:Uncharacterized protein n=1 Tax=viral metagenome TaxID=1070528 RepID=A0A6H2A273_9ZZZZ
MIEKLIKNEDGSFSDENGCDWGDEKSFLQIEILGFCGCGNPDDVMLYVGEMLKKLQKNDWGNYEDLPYMFFVYWANNKNFAEHGGTIRCSWLTDLGEELLKDINYCINKDKEMEV